MPKWTAIGAAGVASGVAAGATAFAAFGLLGGLATPGEGLLLNPAFQSPKLIGFWTEEPLPVIVVHPWALFLAFAVFGVAYAHLYERMRPVLPGPAWRRRAWFGLILWILPYAFFEFFTPFNLASEPVWLLAVQLLLWLAVAMTQAFALGVVVDRLAPRDA
jgi:hypothetical protein